VTAANPSATARGTVFPDISRSFCPSLSISLNSCVPSSPVRAKRYFNTKAVTPLAATYLATSLPSPLMVRAIKPPPGQITSAVPFHNSGEGLKTVRLGLVTLVTTSALQIFEKYSFSG
jgi:hypothetical protein